MTSACNNFQHYWFYQLVASFVLVLIPMGNVSAQPGTLTFVEYVKDDSNGVDGLNGASEKVISPDGNYLYVASLNDSSVAVFARNSSTGALTFLEIHKDDSAGVDGLAGALGMSMNSEGTHLYIASHQDSAIAVFSRNAGSGLLTFIEQVKDDSNGVDGIAWIHTVRVSPDGLHVYAPGYVENELAIFSRNFSDGTLTFIEKIKDDSAGVDGLWNSADLTFSPDGGYVYVTARSDASIATFQRSASTGLLTFVEVQKNDSAGVSGLASVNGVKLSPDGKHVYVAGSGDSSLVVFSRNSSTGALTYVEKFKDDSAGVDGLAVVGAIEISQDGNYVYVGAGGDSALSVYSRNDTTGALTLLEMFKNDSAGISGLGGAGHPDISPDGEYIYISATNSIAIFSRQQPQPLLSVSPLDFDFGPVLVGETRTFEFIHVANDSGLAQITGVTSTDPAFAVPDTVSLPIDINPVSSKYIGLSFTPSSDNSFSGTVTLTTDDPANPTFVVNVSGDGVTAGTGELTFAKAYFDSTGIFTDLHRPGKSVHSPDGSHFYGVLNIEDAIVVMARNAVTGELALLETPTDGVAGVNGLDGPNNMAISPDGDRIYVTSWVSHSLAAFDRNTTTGLLTFDTFVDTTTVEGLHHALVDVSPDNRHVYTASNSDDAILVFNDSLQLIQHIKDDSAGVDGLSGLLTLNVSPDGKHLYAGGQGEDEVAIFSRNPATGVLTFVEIVKDDSNSVNGIAQVRTIVFSPDGAHVYVVGAVDHGFAVFSRNSSTGSLTFLEAHLDDAGGITNMAGPTGLSISPDGAHLYVNSFSEDAINIFNRNSSTGMVTFASDLVDSTMSIVGLDESAAIEIAPNGNHVYVVAGKAVIQFQAYDPVDVALPALFYGGPGDTVKAPIEITNLTSSDGAQSFDATLLFPDSLIEFVGFNTTGFLADGLLIDTVVASRGLGETADTLIITAADSLLFPGDGTLLELLFVVDSNSVDGDTTALDFEDFAFNEGFPVTKLLDGWFENADLHTIGDVDSNGSIQALDASLVLESMIRRFTPEDDNQFWRMDVSGNGEIRAYDASLILKHVAGLITTFAAGSTFIDKPAVPEDIAIDMYVSKAEDQTVTLTVNLVNRIGYSAADLILEFDTGQYQYLGYSIQTDRPEYQVEIQDEKGTLSVAMASAEQAEHAGVLIQLRFRILDAAKSSAVFHLTTLYLDEYLALGPDNVLSTNGLPTRYDLSQNYPNPFNPATTVRYQLPEESSVVIRIYDILGRVVATLVDEQIPAGFYTTQWDGRNQSGLQVASGVYLVRMQTDAFVKTRKMLLLK